MVETIGPDWFFQLTAACQRLAGSTLDSDSAAFAKGVERFRDDLPTACSVFERRVLHDCVIATLTKAGSAWHEAFHRLLSGSRCSRSPMVISPSVWRDSNCDADALLTRWVREYLHTFERDHQWPAHWKVARYLDQHFREPLHVERLAQALGRGRRSLMRDFRRTFGLTIPKYQTRLRLRQAIIDLRARDSNVEAVAKLVGYESPKNFYAALEAATGLTPSEARNLSESQLRHCFDVDLGVRL